MALISQKQKVPFVGLKSADIFASHHR